MTNPPFGMYGEFAPTPTPVSPTEPAMPVQPSEGEQPSVGRIVHYTSYGTPGGEYTSQCRAAVVAAVRDMEPVPEHGRPYVDLVVLNPTGLFFNQRCPFDPAVEPGQRPGGTWHWPERA